MKRRNLLGSAVFALVALALTGCAMISSQQTSPSEQFAMEAFGQSKPDCEIWTNWRKVCSRTGEVGGVLCSEAAMPVSPSAPFCMAETGESYSGLAPDATVAQRESFNRFCVEYADGREQPANVCVRWQTDRPFNSLRLSELAHPWCARWSLAVNPNVNAELSAELGYYCSSRSLPEWCDWEDGLGIGRQINSRNVPDSDRPIIPVLQNPSSRAVNFPHCRRKF